LPASSNPGFSYGFRRRAARRGGGTPPPEHRLHLLPRLPVDLQKGRVPPTPATSSFGFLSSLTYYCNKG
jgi:hypothetical protein